MPPGKLPKETQNMKMEVDSRTCPAMWAESVSRMLCEVGEEVRNSGQPA